MLPYYSLASICDGSISGIRSLIFTDMSNVSNYGPGFLPLVVGNAPSFTSLDLVYSIGFERSTGLITRRSVNDAGGDWHQSAASAYVPRGRQEVDVLLRRWRNRYLCVIAIDRYGSQHLLYDARCTWEYTSGDRPATRHGYNLTFTAASHYILHSIAGEGDITTAPPVGGGGSTPSGDDCCITINPIGIAYTPAPSGNANNRNELVTTPNGSVYFIDSDGRSIILNRPGPQYYRFDATDLGVITEVTLPDTFWIPDPADYAGPTYDPQAEISIRLWVKYGARWLQYTHEEGFDINYGDYKALFPDGIDGGVLEFFSFQGIPPRPL